MRWVTNEGRLCELKCCGDDAEQSGGFGERAVGGFPQGSLLRSVFLTVSTEFADGTELQHIYIKER